MTDKPIRVLVAKPGVDGHDVGAKVVCRALMEAGMQVVYTGLRQSPEAIAAAARELDAEVVGLSIMSGAHLPLSEKVASSLREAGLGSAKLVVGGVIPSRDRPLLAELGVSAVFGVDAALDSIVSWVRANARRQA
ncbi:MAG: cobalamin-dependent protein [Myxococcales bacterium]|nr:cobalamin-dependent protein [Myxococcales bacterium]